VCVCVCVCMFVCVRVNHSAWRCSVRSIYINIWPTKAVIWVISYDTECMKKKRRRKNYVGSESHSPHQLRKRSHFGTEYRKAPPPRKGKENSMGIRRVAGFASNQLLMHASKLQTIILHVQLRATPLLFKLYCLHAASSQVTCNP
jgi:hypothetical protein